MTTIREILNIDNSKCLSIMNPVAKHLLLAGRFCLGNILSQDIELIKVLNVFTYLICSQHDKIHLNTFLL